MRMILSDKRSIPFKQNFRAPLKSSDLQIRNAILMLFHTSRDQFSTHLLTYLPTYLPTYLHQETEEYFVPKICPLLNVCLYLTKALQPRARFHGYFYHLPT